MKARIGFVFSLLLFGLQPRVWAFCQMPQPRLVCAEATSCQAVVIARLLASRHVEPKNDEDYFLYSLRLTRSLRGNLPSNFTVHEGNDSGRATFEWVIGRQYLLFLSWDPTDHGWDLDGCGNSAPFSRASAALKAVEAMDAQVDALISGRASAGPYSKGIAGVTVTASTEGRSFVMITGADGKFHLRVPPGVWSVTARKDGTAISVDALSYSQPDGLHLARGACVQIQFVEEQ